MAQQLYELPEGWKWKDLVSVTEMSRRSIQPKNGREYNYIGLEHIEGGTGRLLDFSATQGNSISSSKTEFSKGMVLYGKLRPYLNKVHVAQFDGIATTEIIPFKCLDEIYSDYLAAYMRSGHFLDAVMSNCSGARMPRATTKFFKSIAKIPLPPLNEQKRIVARLDALFTRIDTAITHLQQTLELTKALFASALDDQFDRLIKQAPLTPFGDVVVNHDGKRVPIKASERKKTHGTYPYYGATGIIDYVDDYIFEGERLLISEDGANLVARKYPIAFLATDKYWVNNHAHIVNAIPNITSNQFLEIFFAWTDLSKFITGAAQPKLSQKKLNGIVVPIPLLDEQNRIVSHFDALSERTHTLEAATQKKLNDLTTLKASLLDAAFKGQL
jgi:type I restriction enzyme S subunit